MREHNFKTEEAAKRYAIIALNQIADLCDELGISFWPGEEDLCDDLSVSFYGSDLEIYHEPDEYIPNLSLSEWLRRHIEQMEKELKEK